MTLSKKGARWLIAVVVVIAIMALGLVLAGPSVTHFVAHEIRKQYGDRVQMTNLHVRLFPAIRISAEEISVPSKNGSGALISIDRLNGETNWAAALAGHVRVVRLEGLKISIPPRRGSAGLHQENKPAKAWLSADRVIADGAVLEIFPKQAGKEPLQFDLYRLTVRGAGADRAMSFETVMKNAKPPGEIHSAGKFGPWQFEDPAATPVSGSYTFRDADLAVFKGISGTLSSDGNYHGVLDHIEVDGSTDTPNFALRISGNPVDLRCRFHAIVDGANGNTYLDPVEGHFGGSTVIARGDIVRQDHQPGRLVTLDSTVTGGRLEDLLRLAIHSPEVMTGAVSFHSKIVIPPGDMDVIQKLQLDGAFMVGQAHFSKLNVQQKINELSHRGRGEPQEAKAGDIASNFRGHFKLDHGVMTFSGLSFDVPGVRIALNGTYGLLDQKMDLRGTATLQAKLSQTTTGWKSVLLKIINPFFEKKNAGAVLPIHIGGTSKSPRFGLSGP
ncbi:MAG TPA: AsmA-like C-terminal region-containing protein [Bryobacteraceae bacterium]|nr:AsmA-like C-terminal region-containing protein [Bryobacteraceae bacterium]